MKVDSHFIKKLLAQKYRRAHGWTFFDEFFYIDGYAIGLQSRNAEILAFEIKISRQDFLKDLNNFHSKQKKALELSNKFYYVCPWGLIEKHEVPDFAGIQYVDSANTVKIKKQATYRSMKKIPFYLLQALAYESGATVNVSDIPVRYLGKEISQEAFQEIVDHAVADKYGYELERGIEKGIKELEKKKSARDAFVQDLKRILWIQEDEKKLMEQALRYCKLGKSFCERYPLKDKIIQLQRQLSEIADLIKEEKQLKLKA